MKTRKFKSALLLLIAALTITSCGKDNSSGGGSTSVGSTLNSSSATGDAGSVVSVEQLVSAVSTGKFSESSTPNVYYFQKDTGILSESCWFGKYSGNFDELYGARALNSDYSIVRNFTMVRNGCNVTLNFDEDPFTGNNLQELANNIVSKINTALNTHDPINNPTVKKIVNGGAVSYFPTNYNCNIYDYQCTNSKSVSSKTWEIKINGEWLRIDLNYALIRQPILRR